MFILPLVMADEKGWNKALNVLRGQEARLGRRLLSVVDRVKDSKVKERLLEVRERTRKRMR